MVTNVLGGYEYFRIVSAEAAGYGVAPRADNDLASLFGPLAAGPDVVEWTFAVETTSPEAIDVVAVDVSSRGEAASPGARESSGRCAATK
jgi:hypothetical protein